MGIDSGTLRGTMKTLLTSDHTSVVSISLFVTLLCACIVICHLLEEHRWMNESITALLIRVGTGVLILLISVGKSSHLLVFSEDIFFFYLLSPIIFNAGLYFFFFQKLDVDLAIGDYFAIGSIFAATNSVCTLEVLNQDETHLLYNLVFCEFSKPRGYTKYIVENLKMFTAVFVSLLCEFPLHEAV